MAAAVSQLCVRQGSTLLDVSSSIKAVKLNRFHLYFTYISTSFSSSEQHPFCSIPTCQVMYRYIYTEIPSLLLSSFISNIYTPEKGY